MGGLKLNGGRLVNCCCWKVGGTDGGWIVLKDGIDVEGTAVGAVFVATELSVTSPKYLQYKKIMRMSWRNRPSFIFEGQSHVISSALYMRINPRQSFSFVFFFWLCSPRINVFKWNRKTIIDKHL